MSDGMKQAQLLWGKEKVHLTWTWTGSGEDIPEETKTRVSLGPGWREAGRGREGRCSTQTRGREREEVWAGECTKAGITGGGE